MFTPIYISLQKEQLNDKNFHKMQAIQFVLFVKRSLDFFLVLGSIQITQ